MNNTFLRLSLFLSLSLSLFLNLQFTLAQTLDDKIDALLVQMSRAEKIYQLTSNTFFTTGDNSRLEIPGIVMSDGPHGVRFGGATSFPTGIAQAASWDVELLEKLGKAMGEEFWARGQHQQLGPCIDLCRDPRNGRSPETLGEDPYLSGKMGAALIRGIQQTPVIATTKHFNLVNRQQYRHSSNITISDRMLMEHYGHNFREAVQEGGTLSIMNAYNLINNVHCSESPYLLQTILRERWGYPFYVVSDWGAVHNTKRAIEAGTDICMGSEHYANDLPNLLSSGAISEETLNQAVRNVLRVKFMSGMLENYPRPPHDVDIDATHEALVLEAGRKALVLLKNQNDILPLDANAITKVALIGPSANKAQLDGFGSSWVEPNYTISPRQGIAKIIGESRITYVKGCDINSTSETGFAAAKQAAADADVVIFVGGLDDTQEGEGFGDRPEYDRKGGSIDLPGKQQKLINELAAMNENVIVVLKSGGICGIEDCIGNIQGLMYAFYPGQEGGNAIAEALFGLYNPGGKLPVTYPKNDGQLPVWNDNFNDDYGCGYRWFDQFNIEPQFAFGFGLSYTKFTYSNLRLLSSNVAVGQTLEVSVDVTNSGEVFGEEVAQLYLTDEASSMVMPKKQLKGFQRICLEAGETETVTFQVTAEDFYFWDETTDSYQIEIGSFIARVGGSSDDLPLEVAFELTEAVAQPDLRISNIWTLPRYPLEGEEVRFMAMVVNEGTKDFTLEDAGILAFNIQDQVVATTNLQSVTIPVGGMQFVEAKESVWKAGEKGMVTVNAVVDSSNEVAETIESNNATSHDFEVFGLDDFQFQPNIALRKPVTASSVESSQYVAANGVDGSTASRWSSLFYDPQEFVVDLQDLYHIHLIIIRWETAYSNRYRLQVSDDRSNWTTIVTENNGDGQLDSHELENIQGRYIRFEGLSRATQWGHSFYELEAYGSLVNDPTTNVEVFPLSDLQLYPNPTRDSLYFSGLEEGMPLEVEVYATDGTLVIEQSLEGKTVLDVTELKEGMYWMVLENKEGKVMRSFVKI